MRENINKVSQRGEQLNILSDKMDNRAVAAQGFRRGTNRARRQMNPCTRTYDAVTQNVARLSIEGYKTIQGLSGSIYEAGTALFSESKNDDIISIKPGGKPVKTAEETFKGYNEEEEVEILNENIVGELLAKWITLPLHHHVTVDDQIENESIERAMRVVPTPVGDSPANREHFQGETSEGKFHLDLS